MRLYRRKARDGSKSQVWQCQFQVGGQVYRLSTDKTDRKEAALRADELLLEKTREHATKKDPETGKPAKCTISLATALEEAWQTHWRKKRYAMSLRYMVPLLQKELGFWMIDEVNYEILSNYCEAKMFDEETNPKGISPSTLNRRMAAIGTALRRQHTKGMLTFMPKIPRFAESNVKERYVSLDEEGLILEWHDKQINDGDVVSKRVEYEYMKQLYIFLIDTGFRFSESFKFTLVPPMKKGGRWIANLAFGLTKNNKARMVPLTARAKAAADYLLASPFHELRDDAGELIDATSANGMVVQKAIYKAWYWCSHRFEKCMKSLKLKGITLHTLRHTCASRLLQNMVPIFSAAQLLGHTSTTMTERYGHLCPDTLGSAVDVLEKMACAAPAQPGKHTTATNWR